MSHTKPVLSRFKQYCSSLPDQLGAALLKDGIYELPGAWKFFARLEHGKPMLLFCPGLTSLACAFARHASRIDVIGLNEAEADLLNELAAFKALANVRILRSAAEISESYATIIALPRNSAPDKRLLRSVLDALAKTQTSEAEWWVLVQRTRGLTLNRIVRSLRSRMPNHKIGSIAESNMRLFQSVNDFMTPAQASAIFARRLPAVHLQLHTSPAFAQPKHIARFDSGSRDEHAGAHALLSWAPPGLSYLVRLLRHLDEIAGTHWRPDHQMRVLDGGKVQVVLCDEAAPTQPQALLKLPLVPHAEFRLSENAKTLTRLHTAQELSETQRRLLPQLLAQGKFENQSYHLESLLAGRSLDQLPAATARTPEQIHRILQCWLALQAKFTRPMHVSEAVFRTVFVETAQAVQDWLELDAAVRARWQRIIEVWHRQFAGRELALGLVHGDFSIKNIMLDPRTQAITGFIDWDLADFCSIPLMDVLHFFIRLDARSFQDTPAAIALRLVKTNEGWHHNHFNNAMQCYGYLPEDWAGIVMLYWQHRLRGYLGSPKNYNLRFVRRQVFEVLQLFEREVLAETMMAGGGRRAHEETCV